MIPLLQIMEQLLQEKSKRTVALGMFVLLLKLEYDVWLQPSTMNMLCRSMLIIPDLKNRTCPDLDDLEAQFPIRMTDRRSVSCVEQGEHFYMCGLFEMITCNYSELPCMSLLHGNS